MWGNVVFHNLQVETILTQRGNDMQTSIHSLVPVRGGPVAPWPGQQGPGAAWACAVLSALTHAHLAGGKLTQAVPMAHSLACGLVPVGSSVLGAEMDCGCSLCVCVPWQVG